MGALYHTFCLGQLAPELILVKRGGAATYYYVCRYTVAKRAKLHVYAKVLRIVHMYSVCDCTCNMYIGVDWGYAAIAYESPALSYTPPSWPGIACVVAPP